MFLAATTRHFSKERGTMNIDINNKNDVLTVILDGRLDSNTAGELDEVLNKELKPETKALVVDMKKVDFVSSKGIRVLVASYRKIESKDITIANANDSIKEIFRISGLLRIFKFE